VEWEELDLIEGTGERPADISLHLATHIVAIDVTVAHVVTASYVYDEARQPGASLDAEEKDKTSNYGWRLRGQDTRFVPFAVDEFGHIGRAGWALLDQMAAHAAATRRHDYRSGRQPAQIRDSLLQTWQRRIALAVRTGIDRSAQRRLALSRRVHRF
jgi:hypothetical protein